MKYIVTDNHIEIYFDHIPNSKIIETLKICGWKWIKVKRCWSNRNNEENLIWVKELSKELNPKEENPLLSLERKTFGVVDLIVRSNSFYCNKHHEIIDMAGEVEVVDQKGNIFCYLIPIAYCKTCDAYFVLENTYKDLKKNGRRIRCEILSYKQYIASKENKNMELSEIGPLKSWGYTVSQEAGYSAIQRQGILEDIIDSGILTKDKVLSYLNFFEKQHCGGSPTALARWEEDYKYISQYKIGSAERKRAGKIIVYEYEYR